MSRARPVVAIDGPAGAGKTTVTRRVAESLGYLLVDTGALYRSVALAARRRKLDWSDEPAIGALSRELAQREAIRFEPEPGGAQRVLLDGDDVTLEIRTQAVAEGASRVSAQREVRAALLELQRRLGRDGGVAMEGRDIGSVVFPDAEAKFFLTASASVRARRRYDELVARGEPADLGLIEAEVEHRDRRDSTRAIAPLVQADDALLVDSSSLAVDQVVSEIVERVKAVERRMRGET